MNEDYEKRADDLSARNDYSERSDHKASNMTPLTKSLADLSPKGNSSVSGKSILKAPTHYFSGQ